VDAYALPRARARVLHCGIAEDDAYQTRIASAKPLANKGYRAIPFCDIALYVFRFCDPAYRFGSGLAGACRTAREQIVTQEGFDSRRANLGLRSLQVRKGVEKGVEKGCRENELPKAFMVRAGMARAGFSGTAEVGEGGPEKPAPS
jgi:hypothetical protein